MTFATYAAVTRRPSVAAGIAGGVAAGLVFGLRRDLDEPTFGVVLSARVVAAAACGAIGKSMLEQFRRGI